MKISRLLKRTKKFKEVKEIAIVEVKKETKETKETEKEITPEVELLNLSKARLMGKVDVLMKRMEDISLTEVSKTNIIHLLRTTRKELKKVNKQLKKQKKKAILPTVSKTPPVKKAVKVPVFKADFEAPKILLGNKVVEHILVGLNYYSNREVMGILLGKDTSDGTEITDVAILPQVGTGGHVELVDDSIAQFMADNFSMFEDGTRILGWWHTHPTFGTTASGTDTQNNKNLIAPFVYGKKPCFMFSIITSKKWSRGGNMYQNWYHKEYEAAPITVEDIQLRIYVFFTLGGFYAEDTVPTYFIEEDSPYGVTSMKPARYNEIVDIFENSMIDKKVDKEEAKKKKLPSSSPVGLPSQARLREEDLSIERPVIHYLEDNTDFDGLEPEEIAEFRCDLTDTCSDHIPIDGDMSGLYCESGQTCGVRQNEIGLNLRQYERY